MTIHESSPFHASMTRLPGGTVGLLTISRAASAAAATTVTRHTIFNVIFDNSGSMGDSTRVGLEAVVRPLVCRRWFSSALITLFDESTSSYEVPNEAAFNDLMKHLPRQGCTNITVGVADSMKRLGEAIRRRPVDEEVHVLTMLLTDGGHNRGAPITAPLASRMRDELLQCRRGANDKASGAPIHHSVLAFCLTDQSDATASMIVKEVLETAKLPGLPSVFYASTHAQMASSLEDIVATCGEMFNAQQNGSVFASIKLAAGTEFIATGSQTVTHHFPAMHTETFVVTLAGDSNWVTVDSQALPVAELPLGADATDVALAAVKDALQPLTRQAVAFDVAAIERRLSSLEALVAAIDQVAAAEKVRGKNGEHGVARTPAERRAMLKRVISAQYGVHEMRNALAALRVRSRSNSDSISLLTGNQRKFAHIASKRSGTESRTAAVVAADTATVGRELHALIRDDLTRLTEAGVDLDATMPVTAVTLQSNAELLGQWTEPTEAAAPGQSNDEGIMDVLSAYGVAAYPVRLVTCDATQVDFSQLKVAEICTQMADSASMMLSWRMNAPIKFADGNTYTELLLLVDPALPRTSTHVLSRSMLVQHLLSAMISKDLYMYLPPMHSAMHTHSFSRAVSKAIELGGPGEGATPVGSFVRLALHVVYSARKLFEAKVIFENDMGSFDRWLKELSSVTRSPTDLVHHVATLSLKLAISTFDINQVDDRTAVLNQLAEHLSRRLAAVTASYASPAAFAQQLFDIQAADAPQPSANDLEPERDELVIRQECRKHLDDHCLDGVAGAALRQLGGHATVRAFVEAEWLELFNLHQFNLAMHEALARRGITMDGFCAAIEREGQIPDWLIAAIQQRLAAMGTDAAAMWAFLGVEGKHVRRVCAAAVMQACLYPGTAERSGVVHEKDLTDPDEMRAMIEQLYMLHYDVACGFKRQRRNAVIGEVTSMQAASADVATFADMIGVHTHGHSRRVFWGMLRGLLADANEHRRQQKLDVFHAKSSKPGFQNVLARAGHGRNC